MSKIKIAVVGVCLSRDPFNSRYVPKYKTWYEVVNSTFQTSIISLMTKEISLSEDELTDTCKKDAHRNNLRDELSKKYINELIDSSPDYIILDLYCDIRYGVVKLKNSYITNVPAKIRQTKYYKQGNYDEIITYHTDKERYMELLNKYFDEFINMVKDKLPKTKILLVKARYAHSYIDNDNTIRHMNMEKYSFTDQENKDWKELNELVQKKYNLEAIDMTKKEYYADPDYPFGFAPWHFEHRYYEDFIKELNEICLRDLLNNN